MTQFPSFRLHFRIIVMEIEEVSMDVAMTVDEACNQWKLSPILRQNLQNEGIQEFFEIQTRAIPQILDGGL